MKSDHRSSLLGRLFDLSTYPIDRPDTDGYEQCVAVARDGLRSVGCAVLRDFVRVERTRQLFGRVLTEHVDAERARVRSDALLD